METKTSQFLALGQDEILWKKLYLANQKEYIRKRLKAIKLLWEGKSRTEVTALLPVGYNTLDRYLNCFIGHSLEEGLKTLVAPRSYNTKQLLSLEQKQELKQILLTTKPADHGLDRQLWTGQLIAELLGEKWSVSLKDSRIYEILGELGLSYQKAHRDYAEADKESQKQFVENLKKNPGFA